MVMFSKRLAKTGGLFLALGALLSAGCAVTTGGSASRLALQAAPVAPYTVCSGGRATRLRGYENLGAVCRQAAELRVVQ